jgi:hypothetical protein
VKAECESNSNDFEVLATHVGVKERSDEAEDITRQVLLEERITTTARYDKSSLQDIINLVTKFGDINVPGIYSLLFFFGK